MSGAISAVIGVVEIAAGAVLDYFSFGTLGNALILAGAANLLGYAVSLLQNPHRAPLIPIGAAYAGTLEPRRILFGQLRVSGMYTAPPLTSGNNNDNLDIVLTVAGHPTTGFGDMYLNQIRIASGDIGPILGTSTDGQVSNTITNNGYQGKVWIRRYLGGQTSPDFMMFTTYTAWDANHIGNNLSYWAIRLLYDTTVFATGVPQISGMVLGAAVYDPRQDSTNGGSGSQRATVPSTWTYSTNPALCLRWYLTSALGLSETQSRIDDVLVAAAANICDQTVSVPIPIVPGLLEWQSGSTIVGGIGTAFLRDLNNGQFVQSGGNFFPTPHPGTTIFLLGPDNNMYAVASVQSDTQLTLSSGFTGSTTTDYVSQWNLSSSTTTTQKRYTCNTLLDATARFEDNITQLARAMMGQCIYSAGKWRMYAGAWSGSAFTLTENDLVGGVSLQCSTPRQNLYNAIRGNFINPARNYQPDEFPPVLNSTYSTADGETIYTETNFPCCTDIFEAQRNAFIVSRVSRNQKVLTAQYGMSAFGIKVWETGVVTIAEVGWVQQTVRCIGWKFSPKGAIELQLQEAYSTDWTDPLPSAYALKGANSTGALSLYVPYPPTGLTATSVAGGISFKVTLPLQSLPGTIIQLFEGATSTPFSSATLILQQTSDTIFLPKFDTITRYYWVRCLSPQEQVSSTFPATTGVAGAALSPSIVWDPIGNLLNTQAWAIGTTGSQGNYAQLLTGGGANGGSNAIILGDGSALTKPFGPFGNTEPLWRAISDSAISTFNGFQNSADLIHIDPTKTYRYCVWMRNLGSGGSTGGQFYIGTDTGGSIENLSPGAVDTNPYFAYVNLGSITQDKWYLGVGVIHGSGYTGGQTGISGIYDPATGDRISAANGLSNGVNVSLGADFRFTPGATSTLIRTFAFVTSAGNIEAFFDRPRFEQLNGQEPSIRDLLTPGVVDPTVTPAQMPTHAPRHGILPRGNVMPMVQDSPFSYTSTTTSISWSWTAFNVYRPDGTSFAMSGSSQSITGLSSSTTYDSYAYSAESAPSTMAFVTGLGGSSGTPAIAFSPSATYAQAAAALANASQLANIYQGKLTGATTSSGSGGGGGGGGGYGCPHPSQWVLTSGGPKRAELLDECDELLTPNGWAPIVKITRPLQHEWILVELDNHERLAVSLDHRFVAPDGEQIRASALRIGQILAAGGPRHLRVISIRIRQDDAEAVSIELADPHLYFLTANGPLSHNLKP